jgi:putative ABC transport system permease protein
VTALLIPSGIIILVVAIVAVRRRAFARIALRSSTRRKGESLLVILGSLLGTAIITGSFLVGDTLDASLAATAETSLGPTDLVVVSADADAGQAAAAALGDFASDDVDGLLAIRAAIASAATPEGESRRAQPQAQLMEVDFTQGSRFGGDPEVTGLSGPTPGDGQTVISENLADDLGVSPGDRIELYAYGTTIALDVERVLPRVGLAGLDVTMDPAAVEFPRNAFVAPGTLEELAAGAGPDAGQPPRDLVLVSATGGVYDAADRTDAVTTQLKQALGDIPAVEVEPVKQTVLDIADEQGDSFRELFIAIGSFAVLAGILLLVNIFVMLAEERKSELGMLRAVGLKRRDLVRIFVIEGSLYAAAAAVLGALLGIGVGRVIVLVTSGIFASFGDLTLTFSAPASSIITGGLIGFLICMVTIAATSLRASRLNIIRAIRDLPEPTNKPRRRWVLVLQVLGVVAFAALSAKAISEAEPIGSMAFPGIAGIFAAAILARYLPRRLVISVVAAGVLGWALFASRLVDFASGDVNVFIVQGVVLTASAVALVAQHQESIGGLVRRLGGNASLTARIGMTYPLARRFRTSMTLAMYSLVVFTLVFISVLSHILGSLTDQTVEAEGGGYDILASMSPTNPVDTDELAAVDGVTDVGTMVVGSAQFKRPDDEDFAPWGLGGVNEDFIAGGPPKLDRWDDRYPNERAVWSALLDDPSLIIPDLFFLQTGTGPPEQPLDIGDRIEVRDPTTGNVSERTVAALGDAGQSLTAWVSEESAADAVAQVAPVRAYVAVEDGADPTDVALRLQGAFIPNGLRADSFRDIALDQTRANTQFFRLMQGFLGLGLVVGIAGLGVIMIRAVRERRREVGMLRSLGFQSAKVRSAFLLESGFVALEGILIGTALSLVTSYQLVAQSNFFGDAKVPFSVPWPQLGLLLGIALVASLLATLAPAQRAASIKPAVALRMAD